MMMIGVNCFIKTEKLSSLPVGDVGLMSCTFHKVLQMYLILRMLLLQKKHHCQILWHGMVFSDQQPRLFPEAADFFCVCNCLLVNITFPSSVIMPTAHLRNQDWPLWTFREVYNPGIHLLPICNSICSIALKLVSSAGLFVEGTHD